MLSTTVSNNYQHLQMLWLNQSSRMLEELSITWVWHDIHSSARFVFVGCLPERPRIEVHAVIMRCKPSNALKFLRRLSSQWLLVMCPSHWLYYMGSFFDMQVTYYIYTIYAANSMWITVRQPYWLISIFLWLGGARLGGSWMTDQLKEQDKLPATDRPHSDKISAPPSFYLLYPYPR